MAQSTVPHPGLTPALILRNLPACDALFHELEQIRAAVTSGPLLADLDNARNALTLWLRPDQWEREEALRQHVLAVGALLWQAQTH